MTDFTPDKAAGLPAPGPAPGLNEIRFRTVFEQSRDGMLLLADDRLLSLNAAALLLLGLPDAQLAVGQPLASFWPEHQPNGRRSADVLRQSMAQATALGWARLEWARPGFDGKWRWDELSFNPLNIDGQVLMHAAWCDVTARRAAADQLRHEKEFSDRLLHHSVDGLVALDPAGRITAWNATATAYSGRALAEVLGRSIYEVLPQFDQPGGRQVLAQVLAGEQLALPGLPFAQRPGRYDAYLVPLKADNQVTGVLVVIRDVAERDRLAEAAAQERLRQQQEVLAAIVNTQETERKRIAEALHNGLGQLLYATKLSLENQAADPTAARDTLRLLDEAIRATRTISFELTPGILEDFGLRTALEELVKRISPRQLPVRLRLRGLEQRLPAALEIALYRIAQELLNNVLKHAQATQVTIKLERSRQRLELTVEDNGCGFVPAALPSAPVTGMGLAGVRNRVALLGGTFGLAAAPGRGTVASVRLAV